MSNWNIRELDLPLKFTWSISRNSSQKKTNLVVEYKSQNVLGLGEVAFNIRYGETLETVKAEFEKFKSLCPKSVLTVGELEPIFKEAGVCNSLRFGIESAFIHNMAHISEISVTKIIGANSLSKVKTSFSLPIMEPGKIQSFIAEHNLKRFSALKLKVGGESDLEMVKELSKNYEGPIRLDANEGWDNPDLVMKWLETDLKGIQIQFIEQPFKSSAHEEYLALKKVSPVEIMADESVLDGDITRDMANQFHGINVKLMKSGSYFKALNQLRSARELGMKTMVGCMIESSLGINSAMNIAYGADYCDLDGFLILKEDPYNYVYEDGGTVFLAHLH